MSIKIDKEFERLIPPLSAEEFTQLEENCLREGIRDPLVVWAVPNGDQILIDGHNRMKISVNHSGIPFEIKQMQFDTRTEAEEWILRNQLGRRNVDKWVRLGMAKRLEEIEKQKAKKRQGARNDIVPNLAPSDQGKTRDKMAEMVGVSHGTYEKMKAIDASDNEEIKAAARSGEISVNKAFEQIKAENAALKRKVQELESQEPKVVTKTVEVVPDDYKAAKTKANAYDREVKRLNDKLNDAYREQRNAEDKITKLQEELTGFSQKSYFREMDTVAVAFESHCEQFIRWVGGYIWITQNPGKLKPERRESVTNAVRMVYEWAGTMLHNLNVEEETNEESGTDSESWKYLEG